jgi:hypothetical protein
VTLDGGLRVCWLNDGLPFEVEAPIGSSLSKDGTNPDVFPMRHLSVSISFELEVRFRISPILLLDFAPVFIYASSITVRAKRLP